MHRAMAFTMARPLRRPAIALCALAGLVATGCATAGSRAPTTPDVVMRKLSAPDQPARRYDTAPTPHPSGVGEEVASAVIAAGKSLGQRIAVDGRLAQLAHWAAGQLVDGRLPPHGPVDDAIHRLGMVEPTPMLGLYRTNEAATLPAHIGRESIALLQQQPATHVGVAVEEMDGSTTAVVALSRRRLTLQPLPRTPGPIPSIELRGELTSELANPVLVVMRPDGSMDRSELGAGPGFAARAKLGVVGVYRIELLAAGEHGTTVLANFPLHVGVPESPHIEMEVAVGDDDQDPATTLVALINRDREAAGLPTLRRTGALDAVATGHSQDMASAGFVGHTSKTTGGVSERVAAAGIATPIALENIGRAYSPGSVHAGLMGSPGHRANILNPHVTHLGVGLVRQSDGGTQSASRPALLVTQVFIQELREIDPTDAARDALEALAAARQKRGVPALKSDDGLAQLARDGADRYFAAGAPSQQQVVAGVNRALQKSSVSYEQVQAIALVGTRPELDGIDALLDPAARAVGIGYAQGPRHDAKVNPVTIAIVLLGY